MTRRDRYAARRLFAAVPTLVVITAIVFALIHAAPGDAFSTAEDGLHRPLPPERLAELRAHYRLDQPLPVRYAAWIADVARGDLGRSFHDGRPVAETILDRAPVTIGLNAAALALAIAVALPLGAVAALAPGGRVDRWSGPLTYALYAVPVFWAALALQIVFSVETGWLPLYGIASLGAERLGALTRFVDIAAHAVLPVTCLAYGAIAYLARFTRNTLLDGALPDAARAARARGIGPARILWTRALRQAAVPMLTLAGFLLPGLVGGSVIVERVFAIPGLGTLLLDSVFRRDVPVVMGVTLVSAVATLAGVLAADLLYGVVDPRVRRARA